MNNTKEYFTCREKCIKRLPKMPSSDQNYVGKLHSGRDLVSCIMFLINHRWLCHFEHKSVICDPIWE